MLANTSKRYFLISDPSPFGPEIPSWTLVCSSDPQGIKDLTIIHQASELDKDTYLKLLEQLQSANREG